MSEDGFLDGPYYPIRRNMRSAHPENDDKLEHVSVDGVVMQTKPPFASIGLGRKIAAASNGPSQVY
jgi:hypothetical protein